MLKLHNVTVFRGYPLHHDSPEPFRAAQYPTTRYGASAPTTFPFACPVLHEVLLLLMGTFDPPVYAGIAVHDAGLTRRGRLDYILADGT